MSYELKKPYTDKDRVDFVINYNHNQNLQIEETDLFLFALEPNEIMGDKEIEVDVFDYDEEEQPIMIEVEEVVTDEDGNEQTVIKQVQSTHKETITIPYPVLNPNYEQEQAQKERERIAKLSLTKREVFLALHHAKQITPEMIKAQIGSNVEALIEFEYAEKYYRFNPLIDTIGGMLGYSSADLDYLFEYKELPPINNEQ